MLPGPMVCLDAAPIEIHVHIFVLFVDVDEN